ncbi:neurogenic locus notch homolog protein 1-like isoform X3 [Patiria miniata]|uniref:EGF-like domain-containing protein n=1 Tax=Patiria miniata TaxID=46514 RepID=A0A914AJJ0_PATMI|nr:neurogenic locus notch homolog protein 1-like isoform X3 [Patiria miniata]
MGLKALSERPSTICVLVFGFALLVTVISGVNSDVISIAQSFFTVSENSAVTIYATRSGGSTASSLRAYTEEGGATSPEDFDAFDDLLSFSNDVLDVPVMIKADEMPEPTECFMVNFEEPSGIRVSSNVTICIRDDDDPCTCPTCDADQCQNGGTCMDAGEADISCQCPGDWRGSRCHIPGQCILQTDDCLQECVGVVGGSFECACYDNFTLQNDSSCSPQFACSSCVNGICVYRANAVCECNRGYRLNAGDAFQCDDIDECFELTDRCDENSRCNNTVGGSYECICDEAYVLNADRRSCTVDSGSLCGTVGGFGCSCSSSFDFINGTLVTTERCFCSQVGWGGPTCQTEINCGADTPTSVCVNGGTCTEIPPSWKGLRYCRCLSGFTGKVCEITCPADIQVYELSGQGRANVVWSPGLYSNHTKFGALTANDFICTNQSGHRVSSGGSYLLGESSVSCQPNRTVTRSRGSCEFTVTVLLDIDECFELTDRCDENSRCNNTAGNYECICDEAYVLNADRRSCTVDSGSLCGTGVVGCDCITGIELINGMAVTHVRCSCSVGWGGPTCQTEINCGADTPTSVCVNGGTCIEIPPSRNGRRKCRCLSGFTGKVCEITCPADIQVYELSGQGRANVVWSPGLYSNHDKFGALTANDFICTNQSGHRVSSGGSYLLGESSVSCQPNRTVTRSRGSCEFTVTVLPDIDECFELTDRCDENSRCNNTVGGSYECICDEAYVLNADRRSCTVDSGSLCGTGVVGCDCITGIDFINGMAVTTVRCSCSVGWGGPTCQTEINCGADTPTSVCVNGGTCIEIPLSRNGRRKCRCLSGFTGKVCEITCPGDIQVYELSGQGRANVVWSPGLYSNHTKFGALTANDFICTNQSGHRVSSGGSYLLGESSVSCQPNRTVTRSRGSCEFTVTVLPDIDECFELTDRCDENSRCNNTVGGSYECICDEAYVLNADRRSCTVDSGSLCGTGVVGCDCITGIELINGMAVTHVRCSCSVGWGGPTCQTEINCGADTPTSVCVNGGTCIEIPPSRNGRRKCRCLSGFTGKVCEITCPADIQVYELSSQGRANVVWSPGLYSNHDKFGALTANDFICTNQSGHRVSSGGSYLLGESSVSCQPNRTVTRSRGSCEFTVTVLPDIDECFELTDRCDENSRCNNTVGGSYECICDEAYVLNADRRSCTVDSGSLCGTGVVGCDCITGIYFINGMAVTTVRCSCSVGWGGPTCQTEINCGADTPTSVCVNGGTCIEIPPSRNGRRKCRCLSGFTGKVCEITCPADIQVYELSGQGRANVVWSPGLYSNHTQFGALTANDFICTNQSGHRVSSGGSYLLGESSVSCQPNRTVTRSRGSCEFTVTVLPDIDECFELTDRCDENSRCNNTVGGSYECICDEAYVLNADRRSCTVDSGSLCGTGVVGCDCITGIDFINGMAVTTVRCSCSVGWGGPTCQTEINCGADTPTSVCVNGGTCIEIPPSRNGRRKCRCLSGFTGKVCEITCPADIQVYELSGQGRANVVWSPGLYSNHTKFGALTANDFICTNQSGHRVSSGGSYLLGESSVSCQPNRTVTRSRGSCEFTVTVLPASSSGSGSGQPSGDGSGNETTEASSSGSGSGQPSGDGSGDETTEASSSGSGSGQTSRDGSGDETTQAMDFTPTRSSLSSGQSSTAAAVIDPTMQASESVTDSPGGDSTTEGAPPEAPHQTTNSAPMVDSLTTEAARPADSSTVEITTTRSVVDSSTAPPPEECPLTQASCQEGTFDADHCECVCPMMLSGRFCQVSNPCLVNSLCPGDSQYCVANVQSDNGYTCVCNYLDGYIMNGNGFCIRKVARIFRLRVFGINGDPVGFIQQFINPSSAASTEVLTVGPKVIFFFLKRSVLTSAVEDVVGIRVVSGGSIIVEFVALFPDENSAPTVSTLQNVLQETRTLDDGSDNLEVDTQYVTDSQSSTSCPQDYCSNGGSCDVSGLFPVFAFTCRCATSFTGEQCESIVLAPATDSPMPSTVEPLTESATQDVSTVLVLVLVFSGLLLLVFILAILVCLHTLMRHRYRAGYVSRYEQPSDPYWTWRNDPIPVFSTNVVPDYEQSGYYGDFNKTLFLGRDEDRRMRRLHQVMSHSPYLQQGLMDLPSKHAGYYMATGHDAYYQENSRDLEVAGRVVRNPNPY